MNPNHKMENIQGDIRFDFKNNGMSQKSSRWKDSWDLSSQCSLKILFSLPMWIVKIWKEKNKQRKGPKRRAMPSLPVFHKQLMNERVCAWYTAWLLPWRGSKLFLSRRWHRLSQQPVGIACEDSLRHRTQSHWLLPRKRWRLYQKEMQDWNSCWGKCSGSSL